MKELYGRIWTDGYSPTINVAYSTGVVTISVTDVNGTRDYSINLAMAEIGDRSLDHSKLQLGTITKNEMGANSVGTNQVEDYAITGPKIATGAVSDDKLENAKANVADLASVATSGSYNDLTNKPIIPVVPNNISSFTNDAGYTVKATYSGTLSALSWAGTAAPYTQSVSIVGILATDNPHIAPVYSSSNATAITEKEEWSKISKAESAAGAITFTCFEDPPEVNINFMVEVVR